MSSQPRLKIEIKDTVFDPTVPLGKPRKVYVKEGHRHLYKVWIYLTGDDLPFVETVSYKLHTTFSDPVRRVTRSLSNPNCQLVLWTWGVFDVKVTVFDKSNRTYGFVHHLTYDKQLEKYRIEIEYVYER